MSIPKLIMHLLRRLTLLVVALPSVLAAQTPRADTPEQVVRSFLDATAGGRWREAADFVDVSQYAESLRETIALARRPRPEFQLTVEELRRHDPDMPLAVAEYQVKRWREQAAEHGMLGEYAGVPTIDSLARLAPRDAAARWLEGTSLVERRRFAQQSARASGCPRDSSQVEAFLRTMTPRQQVIGSVVHTDIAYVLVADRMGDETGVPEVGLAVPPRVLRVVRWGGRWLLRDWQAWRSPMSFTVSCGTG